MERKRRAPARKAAPERKLLLGRGDWIKAGLKVLASDGPEAVLVAPLAAQLGVTKGSFYWHFASREELLDALLEEWREHATQRVIEDVDSQAKPAREKIRRLAQIGASASIDEFGGSLELAMRTWARSNRKVRSAVAAVDKQRIAYLASLYTELGRPVDPELLACLHYAFSAGLRLIFAYPESDKLAIREAVQEQVFFGVGAPAR